MINLKLRRAALVLFTALLLSWIPAYSQYILNGAATQNSCNCYTLTTQTLTQSGSVWNSNKIDLNNTFDFNFNVFLGCQDSTGADGIVFILQPISTSLGATGEGMGFLGVSPSVGISLDTWQNLNLNDPFYDHISIQANGVVAHGSDLAGPVQASPGTYNIEDCAWHTFRISWDPATQWLRAYFDGNLRVETQVNLIRTIFNNDPNVFWGFTAATGGASNLQQFCTALNPGFSTNVVGNSTCANQPITFTDNSVSFAPVRSWFWDFGDGTTSTQKNPPSHLYPGPGIYPVKMVITGLDGCVSDTLKRIVTIGTKPVADFQVFDTCAGSAVRLINQSTNLIGTINQWTWLIDNAVVNGPPAASTPGPHTIKLVVKTDIGCESDTLTKTFTANPVPVIDMMDTKGCINDPVNFSATQIDNATTITQWNWDFGNGATSSIQNPTNTFFRAGNIAVHVNAVASNGCVSQDVIKNIPIGKITVKTNRDTTILPDIPFLLTTTWSAVPSNNTSFLWTPTVGLSDPFIQNPEVSIKDDVTYIVKTTTPEGCEATDTVNIKVFKGSAVYVPTGFTPNGDGRNDYLRGLYIGIKKVHYFRVYNRWGQQIFSTNSLIEGWDGTINRVKQPTGTFVWMLKAEDLAGKIYEMQGISTLIR
jgi:gliding motility-associated-like protein